MKHWCIVLCRSSRAKLQKGSEMDQGTIASPWKRCKAVIQKVVQSCVRCFFDHIFTFQHISTYFNIFQHISTYFNIFQHGIWVVSCQPFCPAFPASVCLRANSGAGMESEWRCHVYSVSSAIILRVFQGFNNLHTRTKIHKDTNPWTGYYTYRYIWRWT